ncbi:MAG TPA: DUF4148 domain-containing protein [Paraburkholderia sp.]|jgi:hypothetical protein
MKSCYTTAVIACAIFVPVLSQAQTSQPVTRDQLRSELIALEQHGYQPNRDDYPVTLERAQAALARERNSGYVQPRT